MKISWEPGSQIPRHYPILTGTTHQQLEFGEEEVVEDLFIEGKSLLDRSTESSEIDRLHGKVIK